MATVQTDDSGAVPTQTPRSRAAIGSTTRTAQSLIDIASRYRHIGVRPRMPDFAAWIDGVDLTRPIADDVKAELRQALWDFEVIFFEAQRITADQQVALASVFGQPAPGSYFERSPEHPNVELITNGPDRPPNIDRWHTDITWLKYPALGTVIQITETPPAGGNTCWASTSKAFAALSPGLQAYLEGLTATHTWEISAFREALQRQGEAQLFNAIRAFPPVQHPVVLQHPDSGRKCLYVNRAFTKRIDGVDYRESQAMLRFLSDWITRPDFMISHSWEAHGIAVWDNRSTQHYATADYWPHRRVNRRVVFEAPDSPQAGLNVHDMIMNGRPMEL
ncbi:MAG: TauD/TfdA family dioxygenase [Burkholderiaceae bacterium]|nr:TauD/TfdA family dioxygenase [Burkholderiaceae bacterium]